MPAIFNVAGGNEKNPATATNPLPVQLSQASVAAAADNPIPTQLSVANAAASASNPVPAQLSQGGAVLSNTNALPVHRTDSTKTTYCATMDYFTPAATPTDILGIVGSATKTVKIKKIIMSGTQTTAGINKWYLIKRGAADTNGTPSSATIVPVDSANAAATAVVRKYTANPTINNTVGNCRIISVLAPAPASVVAGGDTVIFDDAVIGQPITLRGVAEELDINFNGAAVPAGLSVAFTVIFTEE